MAYLPSRGIAVAVTSTQSKGTDVNANAGTTIPRRTATYLAPDSPPAG